MITAGRANWCLEVKTRDAFIKFIKASSSSGDEEAKQGAINSPRKQLFKTADNTGRQT